MRHTHLHARPVSALRSGSHPHARSGFTLFELLIAMVIFISLISILLVVGTRIASAQKDRSTTGVLRALETIFEDWQLQTGQKFPEYLPFVSRSDPAFPALPPQQVTLYGQLVTDNEAFIAPIVDARWEFGARQAVNWPNLAQSVAPINARPATAQPFEIDGRDPNRPGDAPQPSLTLALLAMSEVVPLEQMLSGLDSRLVRRQAVPAFGWTVTRGTTGNVTTANVQPAARLITGPVVRDAFGYPIRFVSPVYQGGVGPYQIPDRRTEGRWIASPTNEQPGTIQFNPSWFDPFGAPNVTGTTELQVSRRGRPNGMPTDSTLKTLVGDADEGICRNGRPYFYSSGSDGDPRTELDNVYSERPSFNTDVGGPRNPQ